MPRRYPSAEKRFWANVDRIGEDECWPWRGHTWRGYGYLNVDGKNTRAHRFAWLLLVGPIPAGRLVLHRCDNPPCCNPRHLFLGTQAENMADAAAKGRMLGGRGRPASGAAVLRGDTHPSTKIPTVALAEIFRLRAEGATQAVIAKRYGVSQATISAILNGKRRQVDGASGIRLGGS